MRSSRQDLSIVGTLSAKVKVKVNRMLVTSQKQKEFAQKQKK